MRGRTSVCIFDGIMDGQMYITILRETLLPFIKDVYPNGHRMMQDNDSKPTSHCTDKFFEQEGVNWWRTPPESPDLNSIENLRHKLKRVSVMRGEASQQGRVGLWNHKVLEDCHS